MCDERDMWLAYHYDQLRQCNLAIPQVHRPEQEREWWREDRDFHQAMIDGYEREAPAEELEQISTAYGLKVFERGRGKELYGVSVIVTGGESRSI